MAKFELKLPKMGESVAEATITSWLKNVGDTIEMDEAILEIATDKVDSEIPSEVEGVLVKKMFDVDDVVKVGETLAIIETDGELSTEATAEKEETKQESVEESESVAQVLKTFETVKQAVAPVSSSESRFYSPLVKNIAKQEGISQAELDSIPGSGMDNRVTKNDIMAYLGQKTVQPEVKPQPVQPQEPAKVSPVQFNGTEQPEPVTVVSGEDEKDAIKAIVELFNIAEE